MIDIQKNSRNLLYSKNVYQRNYINILFIVNQLTKKNSKYDFFFFEKRFLISK